MFCLLVYGLVQRTASAALWTRVTIAFSLGVSGGWELGAVAPPPKAQCPLLGRLTGGMSLIRGKAESARDGAGFARPSRREVLRAVASLSLNVHGALANCGNRVHAAPDSGAMTSCSRAALRGRHPTSLFAVEARLTLLLAFADAKLWLERLRVGFLWYPLQPFGMSHDSHSQACMGQPTLVTCNSLHKFQV